MRLRTGFAVAAAGLLLAGCASSGSTQAGSPSDGSSQSSLPSSSAASSSTPAPAPVSSGSGTPSSASTPSPDPKAAATAAVEEQLADVPAPPGAVPATNEVGGLQGALSEIGSANLVHRTRWWTAPGTIDATIDWLRAHRPAGWTVSGTSDMTGAGKRSIGITFGTDSGLTVQYATTAFDGGVALLADVSTVWVPTRPDWSYVPASVTSVDVTVVRRDPQRDADEPTVFRTLTGDDLATLAKAVNAFAEQPPYDRFSCPLDLIGEVRTDTLVFTTPDGSLTVTERMDGCWLMTVSDGTRTITLDGSVDNVVLKVLGLPTSYGGS